MMINNVNTAKVFSRNRHEKLVGWPVIKAYRFIYGENRWACFIPDIKLRSRIKIPDRFKYFSKEKKERVVKNQAWVKWCTAIPENIFRMIRPFRNGQWMCLSVLARCGEPAMELAESNPALFFALANNRYLGIKKKNNMAFIRRTLKYPRRKIAEILGFPGTEKTVRILKKVTQNECSTKMIYFLRKSLNEEGSSVQYFSHLPTITAHAVSLSRNEFSSTVNYNLLESAVRFKGKREVAGITVKLLELTKLYSTFFNRPVPMIRSVEKLNSLHSELSRYFNLVKMGREDIPVNTPPFRSDPEQVEIFRSTSRVLAESYDMRNCLKDHLQKLFSGQYYALRILRKKLTLMIKCTPEGFEIEDMKGFANKVPSVKTRKYVEERLHNAFQTGYFDVSELNNSGQDETETDEEQENIVSSDLNSDEIPF